MSGSNPTAIVLASNNPTATGDVDVSTAIIAVTIDGHATVTAVAISVSKVPPGVTGTSSTNTVPVATQAAPSATPTTEQQQSTGPPLSTLLPAIVAPVVFLLILASIVLFTCLHYRNKKREREQLASLDHGGPAETSLLQHKASQSFTLPSPFTDGERIKDGQLDVYEKRRSLGFDRDRRGTNGDIVALYERPSTTSRIHDIEKYTAPRAPPPTVKPMPALPPSQQKRPPPQARPPPQQRAQPPPPPQKPFAPAPVSRAPPKDQAAPSWPLPAGGPLPSPGSFHSARSGQSDKAEKFDPNTFQLPPLSSSEPFSMREALRPDSDTYDLSTSAATGPHPAVPPLPGHAASHSDTSASASDPFDSQRTSKRDRDSDAVSELSYRASMDATRAARAHRDTDTLSIVSAMSKN